MGPYLAVTHLPLPQIAKSCRSLTAVVRPAVPASPCERERNVMLQKAGMMPAMTNMAALVC